MTNFWLMIRSDFSFRRLAAPGGERPPTVRTGPDRTEGDRTFTKCSFSQASRIQCSSRRRTSPSPDLTQAGGHLVQGDAGHLGRRRVVWVEREELLAQQAQALLLPASFLLLELVHAVVRHVELRQRHVENRQPTGTGNRLHR
ncbi:hypothetical protein ANANG_G00146400 [Anguilla anguilla]|uniref:Uncharacterized protein n=1 Tax=Anguilla anguilla TaxID=7936 RepID=A0A9D3MBT8_ANGAN|nr:hypothetical protein ANANG_G00146400 [Anguilla anguilla]